jgi:hypothetical protein
MILATVNGDQLAAGVAKLIAGCVIGRLVAIAANFLEIGGRD